MGLDLKGYGFVAKRACYEHFCRRLRLATTQSPTSKLLHTVSGSNGFSDRSSGPEVVLNKAAMVSQQICIAARCYKRRKKFPPRAVLRPPIRPILHTMSPRDVSSSDLFSCFTYWTSRLRRFPFGQLRAFSCSSSRRTKHEGVWRGYIHN